MIDNYWKSPMVKALGNEEKSELDDNVALNAGIFM